MAKAKDTDTINIRGVDVSVENAIEIIELSIRILEGGQTKSEWFDAVERAGIPNDPDF